jgi:hypothetical protein
MGNKAIAGTGTGSLAASLVAVALWYFGVSPPQEIVLALQGLVAAPLTYAAIYFTPHNAPPTGSPSP